MQKNIDVACIQETHLNINHRFTIRGYQTLKMNREGRHKGGVLILVENSIAAKDLQVDTNGKAEIHNVLKSQKTTLSSPYSICKAHLIKISPYRQWKYQQKIA